MKLNQIVSMIPVILMTVIGISTYSCRSNDLGNKRSDRVPVKLGLIGWESGAGQVITQKCANCHTSHRSQYVPSNTPHILDGIESADFFDKPENRGLARAMRKRIESAEAVRQMPPKFATPLFEDEKTVLIAFLKAIEEKASAPVPCAEKAASLLTLDHGADDGAGSGSSNQPQTGGGSPCPTPKVDPVDPTVPPPAKVVFADISVIVTKTCGMCHDGDIQFSLMTREDFIAKGDLPYQEIMAGSMPQGDAAWKDTPDGQKVIQWLKGTKD